MNSESIPVSMEILRSSIDMGKFEHAAAARRKSESIIVRMVFSDGAMGYGEALPREYVTGETLDTVVNDLCNLIWPAIVADGLAWPGVLVVDSLGRCINAALGAADIATFDVKWPGLDNCDPDIVAAFGKGDAAISARVSGVLGASDPDRTARKLRLMRWGGLRDFKLKLGMGDDVDAANLRVVHRKLARAIACGKCTLRVDVNGAWDAEETPQRVEALQQYGVCVVEQPVYCGAGELVELASKCVIPLMADETLLSEVDAHTLIAAGDRIWWSIRLSKNGGIVRSLRLARLAEASGIPFIIGCMVGESSIISAAQRRLLQFAPSPVFVEGNYGRFLLADDLTAKSLRFGYAGRLKALAGCCLGVVPAPAKLDSYTTSIALLER